MSWVRLDDKTFVNPKLGAVSDGAFRLYINALCYAAMNETDGFVPETAIAQLLPAAAATASRPRALATAAQSLVDAGCWHPAERATTQGWEIHDFLEYNPSHADKEQDRAAARQRMAGRRNQRSRANNSKRSPNVRANNTRTPGEVPANNQRSSREVREMFSDPDPVPDPVPVDLRSHVNAEIGDGQDTSTRDREERMRA